MKGAETGKLYDVDIEWICPSAFLAPELEENHYSVPRFSSS